MSYALNVAGILGLLVDIFYELMCFSFQIDNSLGLIRC